MRRYVRWVRVPGPVKRVTNPLIGRVPIQIASGVNRGLKWSLASSGGGYGSGRRAAQQMRILSALLGPGDIVWDLGAHHGYVTLCAARRIGPTGRVHAFEPSVTNRWFLARHLAWNEIRNATVHPYAVSSFDGQARFGGRGTSKTFALGAGEHVVEVRSVRSLLATGGSPRPSFVKMDVEGSEAEILRDALAVWRSDTRLLIAVHSAALREACLRLLGEAGYAAIESRRMREFSADRWRGDADLYAFGPAHAAAARDAALLERSEF